LISSYADALERTFTTLTHLGWESPPEDMTNSGRTPVYVCEVADLTEYATPITFIDVKGVPSIALPCRYRELTMKDELVTAGTIAAHEATHVFNNTYCPMDSDRAPMWEWFDDATAVYVEQLLFPKLPQHLRHRMDWVDEPDAALDAEWARYERALFIQYICDRPIADPHFLAKVWAESQHFDTPREALGRLIDREDGDGLFASADPEIADVFGSGYCVDSYFVSAMAPDVYARYQERAITESFRLGPRQPFSLKENDSVDHLACRYYRFYPNDDAAKLKVTLEAVTSNAGTEDLKITLLAVDTGLHRGNVARTTRLSSSEKVVLEAEISSFNPSTVDHAVLVVANCGYEDDVEYLIKGDTA